MKKAGGTVVWYGTWRVNAVLGVSRSIGDRQLKHIIIPLPEVRPPAPLPYASMPSGSHSSTSCRFPATQIQITELSPYDEFMVLGSDGLWDFMKEDEVVEFVRNTAKTKSREEVPSSSFLSSSSSYVLLPLLPLTLLARLRPQVCNALIEHVVEEKKGKDNVTVIVVFFDHASGNSGQQNN